AISKQLPESRVCLVLFDVEPGDLPSPLSQFQATPFNELEMYKLVRTVNGALGENKLGEKILENVFQMWWPELKAKVTQIIATADTVSVPSRSDRDLLLEILELSRLAARHSSMPYALEAMRELIASYKEIR